MFINRTDAGKKLAEKLVKYKGTDCIVLGIARGGLPVAKEVASKLGCDFDIVITRKLGFPSDPETAMGAISQDGSVVLDTQNIKTMAVSEEEIKQVIDTEKKEIARRLMVYHSQKPYPNLENKIVILVDDGLATGLTAKATINFLRAKDVKKIVLAAPVAPSVVADSLRPLVDELIVLSEENNFMAV